LFQVFTRRTNHNLKEARPEMTVTQGEHKARTWHNQPDPDAVRERVSQLIEQRNDILSAEAVAEVLLGHQFKPLTRLGALKMICRCGRPSPGESFATQAVDHARHQADVLMETFTRRLEAAGLNP
jgi:hypothetical protein